MNNLTFQIDLDRFDTTFAGLVSPIQNTIPAVKLYELDLTEYAANQVELAPEEVYASWSKAMDLNATCEGLRSASLWRGFYQTILGENWELEYMAIENSIGSTDSVMQFIPPHANQQRGAATMVEEIAKATLGKKYVVKLLSGAAGVTNEAAEKEAQDLIVEAAKQGKKVWFISQGMASRSFSVPNIDVVLLTYDGGSMGATQQKLSRAMTAGDENKISKVVSISIDPNREDKLAGIILDAAVKAAERKGTDLNDELLLAHATFPLFTHKGDAVLPITADDYLERAMRLNSVKRLAVSREKLTTLDPEIAKDMVSLINRDLRRDNRLGEKEAGQKGERFHDKIQRNAGDKTDENGAKAINTLLDMLTAFVERVEYVSYLVDTETPSISNILDIAESSDNIMDEFIGVAGMTPNMVKQCFDRGLLSRNWVDGTILAARKDH
jgi:hypothetical protein